MVGHEIKSRAETTIIENNRIVDGNSSASYSIDLPNGGAAFIENNVIQQGQGSQNAVIVSYAAETPLKPYANSELLVSGNTILNEKISPLAVAIANRSTIVAEVSDNDVYGLTAQKIVTGPATEIGNMILGAAPALDTSHPWNPSRWDSLVAGRAGDDVLAGTTAGEVIVGAAGSDTLIGGGGNDRLVGGFGNDVLKGGAGADALVGGPGQDHLTGGAGADAFVFGADAVAPGQPTDTIADFRAAEGDKIRLGIDAISGATMRSRISARRASAESRASSTTRLQRAA